MRSRGTRKAMGAAALALLITVGGCGESGSDDPSPSSAVSTAEAAEERARYDDYVSYEHLRVGTPELRDHEATVEGDTALVTMCVNEGPWTVEANVPNIQQPMDEFYAITYPLDLVDGAWLMTSQGENPPEDFTC